MRLGVIDIGSNTVHLLVVDAHAGAHPLPAFSHKIDLRLSEHLTPDGLISDDLTVRLVEFIRECLEIAEDQGVEELLAFRHVRHAQGAERRRSSNGSGRRRVSRSRS